MKPMAYDGSKDEPAAPRIEDHLGLVRAVVSKFHRGGHIEDSELYSVGCVALVDARRTYDPERSKFCTWAMRLIRQRVIDECSRRRRESYSGEMDEFVDDEPNDLPVHLVPDLLKGHESTEEGRMLVGHYMDGKSLAEIGREFGISKESARKRIMSAASAIRRKSRSILENFV